MQFQKNLLVSLFFLTFLDASSLIQVVESSEQFSFISKTEFIFLLQGF